MRFSLNLRMPRIQLIKPGSKLDLFLGRHLGSEQFSYQEIFSMFFPILVDQFFLYFMNILTTSMVSASSQEAVSAVSLVSPIFSMISAIFGAVSAGGTVIVAQYKGRGDGAKTRLAAGQVVLTTVIIGVFSCAVMIIFAKPLLNLLYAGLEPLVLEKAVQYMIGLGISLISFAFYMGCFAVFRGTGASKVCLNLTVIINGAYLLASILFLNILKLDIVGTGLALNAARILGGVCAVISLMNPGSPTRVSLGDIFRVDFGILGSVFKVGIPFAFEQLFASGGTLIVQTYLVAFGTASVAANAITNSLLSVMYAAGASVMTLSITIVGQCIGAKDHDLARKYGKRMTIMTTIMNCISIVVFAPALPLLLGLFQAPAETTDIIYSLLWIAIPALPLFWSVSSVIPGVLRSAGDSAFASAVSLIITWVVSVGLGWVFCFPMGMQVHGLWVATVVGWAVRTVIFWIRFRGKAWLTKKAIKD